MNCGIRVTWFDRPAKERRFRPAALPPMMREPQQLPTVPPVSQELSGGRRFRKMLMTVCLTATD